MRATEILQRGIQETRFADTTYSHTGVRDFSEEKPEILRINPKGPSQKPRTKVSQNNSYT